MCSTAHPVFWGQEERVHGLSLPRSWLTLGKCSSFTQLPGQHKTVTQCQWKELWPEATESRNDLLTFVFVFSYIRLSLRREPKKQPPLLPAYSLALNGTAWPVSPPQLPPLLIAGDLRHAWHAEPGCGGMLLSSSRWNQWPGLFFSRNSCGLGPELGVGCNSTLCSKGLHCWDVSERCYNLSAPWHGDKGYFCSVSLKGLSSHHCDTQELSGLITCPWEIKTLLCLIFLLQRELIKLGGGFTSTRVCFSAVSGVWQNLSSKF